jgi:ankyrin repeat protein
MVAWYEKWELFRKIVKMDGVNKPSQKGIDAAKHSKHFALANRLALMQDVDQLDDMGNSRLHNAIYYGELDVVQHLVARKANVNMKCPLGYPLVLASQHLHSQRGYHTPDAKGII